jgi:hypothetical protein
VSVVSNCNLCSCNLHSEQIRYPIRTLVVLLVTHHTSVIYVTIHRQWVGRWKQWIYFTQKHACILWRSVRVSVSHTSPLRGFILSHRVVRCQRCPLQCLRTRLCSLVQSHRERQGRHGPFLCDRFISDLKLGYAHFRAYPFTCCYLSGNEQFIVHYCLNQLQNDPSLEQWCSIWVTSAPGDNRRRAGYVKLKRKILLHNKHLMYFGCPL